MSQPELPDLKKKEKERKKSGAAWHFGNGGAGSFEGALGANGARSAASAAARAAAEAFEGVGSRAATWIGRLLERMLGNSGFLARLVAPLMGSAVGELTAAALLMGAVAAVVGAGIYAASMMMGGAQNPAGGMSPELGGLSDSLHVAKGGSDGMNYLKSKGELSFGDAAKNTEAGKDAGAKDGAKQDDPATKTDLDGERPSGMTDRLAHNLSGAKLSSSLGGGFGKANIFANSATPKFGAIGSSLGLNRKAANQGKINSFKNPARTAQVAMRGKGMGIKSPRAIGQLKAANALSGSALTNPNMDQAAQKASDAFNGNSTPQSPSVNSPTDTTSPSNGSNGNNGTNGTTPTVPTTPPTTCTGQDCGGTPTPVNVSPWQGNLDQIKQLAAMAGKLKMLGLMLIAIGMAVMPIYPPITVPIGMMLIGMGIAFLMMAAKLKAQADAMAQQIQQAEGQNTHGVDTMDCTNQAYNNGGSTPDSCQGSKQVSLDSTAGQDAKTESNSGYTTEGGSTSTK